MNKLGGEVALITGGAQGIGKSIAEIFLGEGASVALCDINLDGAQATARILSQGGGTCVAYAMNVADEVSVSAAVKSITGDFGSIDILANNAGITRDNLMIRMKKED